MFKLVHNFFARIKLCQTNAMRRHGQSTVELALLLPTLMLMLGFIIYAYKVNHKLNDEATANFGEKMYKYHMENMIYDPEKGVYVAEGDYSEIIPKSGTISAEDIAKAAASFGAQLGLSALFSKLNIFDTSTYGGAFAQGFTYSLASSSVDHLINDGNLQDMSAADLENATWAGAASAMSSQQATEDFQGGEGETAGTASGAREFFGSGAQAGLIGFAESKGDWKAGATSAVGGMINSDTTAGWAESGTDGSQILKGAGLGAVESSADGLITNGKIDGKTVLVGAATGAVHTDAFARTLPLTGKTDQKNSAMYGAFNGAFSTVVSGGDTKSTLVAAGTGALGSKQTTNALGGSKSFTSQAVNIAGGAAGGLVKGESLKAVGQGALTSAVGSAVGSAAGWAGNQISPSFKSMFGSSKTSNEVTQNIRSPEAAEQTGNDTAFIESNDSILDGVDASIYESEYLKSIKGKKKVENGEEEEAPKDGGGTA